MKLNLKAVAIIFLLSLFFSCSAQKNDLIKDIIPVITMNSGESKNIIIPDLFYSENYNLKFEENGDIKIESVPSNDTLKLNAGSEFAGLKLLGFRLDGEEFVIPVNVKKQTFYNFTYKPQQKYNTLTLFGTFNGWNRYNLPMSDENNDGIYEVSVALEPGVYQYKFFADGKEIADSENPVKVSNGMGDFNSVRVIEEDPSSKMFLHVDRFEQEEDSCSFSFIAEYRTKSVLFPEEVFVLLDNKKIDKEFINVRGTRIIVTLPKEYFSEKNLLRTGFEKNGVVSNIQSVVLANGKPIDNNQFTWNDAIIYSLMIDRFNDGDSSLNKPVIHDSLLAKANYIGGDLQGVINKISDGYFDSLGINTLWISPVVDNPEEAFREYPAPHRYYSGYHGYWPISSTKVENRFGDMNKLKELISTAHQKNIKVLLDFVSNHTHMEHPYFKNHRDWYGKLELPNGELNLRRWDEYRLTTWFEPYLPSFDYLGSPEALDTMTSNAVWWLKETGADGYRHDAVKHVPNEFWRTLSKKIKSQVASERALPVYQIGETFGSYDLISSYVNNGQLSAQFNFNLYDVAIPAFIKDDYSFANLDKEMNKTFSVYGNLHLMGNVMDSHDKNRFMIYADGDLDVSEWSAGEVGWNNPPVVDNPESYKKLVLYMAYMNSIPGIPVIYYGSEFGMTGASDPDNRRMMRFDGKLSEAEKETLHQVEKIVGIRKQHSALRYGDFYTLQADENVYSYIRSDMNERIVVVINKGSNPVELNLTIPLSYDLTKLISLKDNSEINSDNNQTIIKLSAKDWQMYILQ